MLLQSVLTVCLARDDGTEVVGADSNVGGVGDTPGSVGHGVSQGSVGGGNSTVGEGVTGVSITSIAEVVAQTWRVHSFKEV